MGVAREEWRQHWKIVVAAVAGVSLGAIPAYAMGLFIHPLEEAFGWSRAGISLSLTIYAVVGMLGAPWVGMLIDRFGARKISLIGVSLFCSLIALLATISSSIWSWWGMWLLIGVAALGIKPTVWSKAVTSFFHQGRGLALACMASGTGLATIVLPSYNHFLIETFGWRMAFLGTAGAFALVVLPLVWCWFFDASDRPADPASTDLRSKAERLRDMPGWTAHEGLRRRALYQIGLAALLATGVITGYSLHIVPMLTHAGIERGEVVKLFSMVGVLAVVSRLTVGWIFDKVQHPAVGTISIALPIMPALVLLLVEPGIGMAILAIALLGIAIGGEYDAVIYLSSRFFGVKAFGFLFGIVASLMLAGVALGPLLAGLVFDHSRSYDIYYAATIPVSLLAGLLVATLGRYPDHEAAVEPVHQRARDHPGTPAKR